MSGTGPVLLQRRNDGAQRRSVCQVPCEDLLNHGSFCRIDLHAARVARAVRVDAVAIGHTGPGQQRATTQLGQPPPPHPLGNEGALVFGHRPTDLQQQLVVGVGRHGTVEELDHTAKALQFFQQQDLVDILARQAIRRGDEDALHFRTGHRVAQRI